MSWWQEHFASPGAAATLPVALAVGFGALWFDRRRTRRLERLAGRRAPVLAREVAAGRRRVRRRLALGAALLLPLAAMQPRFGERPARAEERGVDLVLCLDVSRSMLAEDLDPSRLARARASVAALCESSRGDRLGLVAFAGVPRRVAPLTRDAASLAELAARTDPWSVPLGGTDLAAALDLALATLASARRGAAEDLADVAVDGGVIVLLTDGADPTGAGQAAAARSRERGVTVHCLGFGSALGAKIPVVGDDGRETFVTDRDGNDVVSRLDAASLRAIAAAGGGEYVDAATRTAPLVSLHRGAILPGAERTPGATAGTERPNRYRLPLLLALALLLVEAGIHERRRA